MCGVKAAAEGKPPACRGAGHTDPGQRYPVAASVCHLDEGVTLPTLDYLEQESLVSRHRKADMATHPSGMGRGRLQKAETQGASCALATLHDCWGRFVPGDSERFREQVAEDKLLRHRRSLLLPSRP